MLLRPAAESGAATPFATAEHADASLAGRELLEGLYGDDRLTAETEVVLAERAIAENRYADAIAIITDCHPARSTFPDLVLRALFVESWARMYQGEVEEAITLLEHGRAIAEQSWSSDVDRADALYRLGCCRYQLSSIATAASLFTVALDLCDRSPLACDRLRAQILEWRSRCYRRQRDWEAARADIERALELAEGIGDRHTAAHVYVQASLVAERTGDTLLARFYAEEAKGIYESYGDRANVGRLLSNLGGLEFLLGETAAAVSSLEQAARVSTEAGSPADAAQAISSLAQVNLRTGDLTLAEEHAKQAIELLERRADFAYELGSAQLVLGRSLLEQGRLDEAERCFRECERTMEGVSSDSHLAAVWIARGDLAAARGDKSGAADLFRRAAESLQDVRF